MGFYEKDKEYVLNTYKRIPVEIVRGEGGYVWDVNGKKYLDFFSGIAVLHLGHNNKELNDKVKAQIDKYMHLSNYFASEPVVELAKKLVENSFAEKIFFTNSGTESTEGALKMAVKWGREIKKEKVEVLSSLNSFHGRSTGGLALTGQPEKQVPFEGLLPKFKHFNYNDIESFKAMLNENTCAVFLEAIQGEGGIVELDREFVKEMKKLQAKYNFLIIMDEIQAGLRRTAYELFAYEAYGVEPDIVTLAKGLGGGLPLGAILIGEKAVNTFGLGDHGTTFGGNPVACAAGNHIMSLMCDDDFVKKIEENAGYFRSKLEGLKNKYSVIEEIRGRGFMIGLEMGEYAEKTKNVALEKGMLLNVTAKTVLRLIPRINIPKEEIDEFVNKFEEILKTF
jgi:acetylornithine/N-succinyldiaminopimelate aminotransferase